jgi:hypothetical protein
MKKKQRLEITIETHEVTILRFRQSRTTMIFCEMCQAQVPHLNIAQTISVLSLSEPDFNDLITTGQIHSTENSGGLLMLCSNSLSALTKEKI